LSTIRFVNQRSHKCGVHEFNNEVRSQLAVCKTIALRDQTIRLTFERLGCHQRRGMTFVSYAQNFEDVMLHRALSDVPRGFYIDVGAADPEALSVTKAFYDNGWQGINVEPDPDYAANLRVARTRDVTVQAALGATPGRMVINRIAGTGLSTFDGDLAARHVAAGYSSTPLEVEVTTLSEVCRGHAPADIHFLKIDVEGAERAVLQGADFSIHRPWIVVVEATEPFLPTPNHQAWETILLDAAYVFVWFDGLNRFYVAQEHEDALRPAFLAPPNFFDYFERAVEVALRSRAEEAEERAREAEVRAKAAELRANESAAALAILHASKSWRATAPFRAIAALARRLRS